MFLEIKLNILLTVFDRPVLTRAPSGTVFVVKFFVYLKGGQSFLFCASLQLAQRTSTVAQKKGTSTNKKLKAMGRGQAEPVMSTQQNIC